MLKILKITGFLSAVILFVVSCNTTAKNMKDEGSEIQSVSLTNTFGRGGNTIITATKDSLISENNSIASKEIPTFKRKIDPKEWDLIISTINLNTVKLIQSGKSRGYYDGPDEIFEISTNDKKYTLTNVTDSLKYRQLRNLKVLLKKIVSQKE